MLRPWFKMRLNSFLGFQLRGAESTTFMFRLGMYFGVQDDFFSETMLKV